MADKSNQKDTQNAPQRNQRPSGEQVQARERPMDDPGRGHGDVFEDELSKESGDRVTRDTGQGRS